MNISINQKDIHGDFIHEGDTVHYWDGDINQRNIDQSLTGQVHKAIHTGSDNWCVSGNELALGCAQFVEIINNGDSNNE
jgi:hypothetical protein